MMKNRKEPLETTGQGKKTNSISTDPFGSYTGIPFEGYEKPVQDADDL